MPKLNCLARISLLAAIGIFSVEVRAQTAENVLVVTYDGLRWQEVFGGADATLLESSATKNREAIMEKYWAESALERRDKLLPFFWSAIVEEGQIFGDDESDSISVVTNGRNFSYPGYNELLTGSADDRIDSNSKTPNPNVTVLEWLDKQPGFEGKVAAFASWDVFPYIINTERSGVPVNAGWAPLTESANPERLRWLNRLQSETPHYWGGVRFDAFTHYGAVEYIKKHTPRVIYVAYGETDDWAHDGRYDLYLDAARRTDDYIGRLWELLQSMPEYAGKTAFVMSTDHGRGDTVEDWRGHGSNVEGCERIWMAMMGAGVPAKGVVSGVETTQSQFAPTIAALLGLDFAPKGQSVAAPIRP